LHVSFQLSLLDVPSIYDNTMISISVTMHKLT
jgi:hypothetical protein